MTDDLEPTTFRRLFVYHNILCAEVGPGQIWYLPQTGKPYNPAKVFAAVKAANVVNLSRWKRLQHH